MTKVEVSFKNTLTPEIANSVVAVNLTLVSKSDVRSSISQNIREVRCEIISSPFSFPKNVDSTMIVVIPHRNVS